MSSDVRERAGLFWQGGLHNMEMTFGRQRSELWFKLIADVRNGIYVSQTAQARIIANTMTSRLIMARFPEIVVMSPEGWEETKNDRVSKLWLPRVEIGHDNLGSLEPLLKWGEQANLHIWLGRNKNIKSFFDGSELSFCLAGDWNISPIDWKRTQVGEAEYELKYEWPIERISDARAAMQLDVLKDVIRDCISCLPPVQKNWVVAALPYAPGGERKIAYRLARWTARELNKPFLDMPIKSKPSLKDLDLNCKVRAWRKILPEANGPSIDIMDKTVLVIDDLYQSGASVWCFAEYLRKVGAGQVVAIALVKALRDGDNR